MEDIPLRIYADFNGLVRGVRRRERTAVVVDTFGSVRDLANAGVVLATGLPLIAFDASDDHEDLEGHGTAQYDTRREWWVVEFDEQGVRYVPASGRTDAIEFLCVRCRRAIPELSTYAGFHTDTKCPSCGASALAPIAPPQLAT